MLNTEQVKAIASRRAGGEGLEQIIESMGLPVLATLLDLKKNYRQEMDTAKVTQRQIIALNTATSSGGFVG